MVAMDHQNWSCVRLATYFYYLRLNSSQQSVIGPHSHSSSAGNVCKLNGEICSYDLLLPSVRFQLILTSQLDKNRLI